MSTPLENLSRPMPQIQQNDNTPQQIMDYGEILRTMQDDTPSQQQQQQYQQQVPQQQPVQQQQLPQNHFIPPPAVQSLRPQGYVMQQQKEEPPVVANENQKDLLILFVLCVIIYNESFQNFLKRILPSLYRNERLTSVGTIAVAGMITGGLYLSKGISFKFI